VPSTSSSVENDRHRRSKQRSRSAGLGHIGVIDSSRKKRSVATQGHPGGTMNKFTFALALTVVVGAMSGLLTLVVATGTVSVLTLQSQTAMACGQGSGC
jgi:ACT domain-containing protein